MKLTKLLTAPLIAILLTGCSGTRQYSSQEYLMKLDFKNAHFNILQMSDVHLSLSDDLDYQFKFMDLSVSDAIKRCKDVGESLNLIVLNGDIFTYADKRTVNEVFSFFDSYHIPWTFTYGNHDDQGYYSDHYIEEVFASGRYDWAWFKSFNDNVSGRSNFAIDLVGPSNEHVYQLYFFDSHSYRFHDYFYYDYIKEDQIEWYRKMIYDTNPERVKSTAFFHIPLPEYRNAVEEIQKDPSVNVEGAGVNEVVAAPRYNSGLFKAFKANGTISVHCSHDHINNFEVLYDGIKLCYGVKATDRIYSNETIMGATMVSIANDYQTVTTKSILHTYAEVK